MFSSSSMRYRAKGPTLLSRIQACNNLVIQSVEKTLQQKIIYMFLKDRQIENEVSKFYFNGQSGIVKLEFYSHQSAMKFYEQTSFKEAFLLRKFNIYLDLSASQDEIKRYFLRGVDEGKMRSAFEKCRKFGFIRMNTLYGPNGKMKDTCILCYLRTEPLSNDQFKQLYIALKKINVGLDIYRDRQSNASYIKPIQQSWIKQLQKIEVPEEKQQQPQWKYVNYVTFITIHEKKQEEVYYSDEQLISKLEKECERQFWKIGIDRVLIPTLDPARKRVVINREIQFESSEPEEAEQLFNTLKEFLRKSKCQGIIYLCEHDGISSLFLTNPKRFAVKAIKENCTIMERTENEGKFIKIAELSYKELDDITYQREQIQLSLYKCSRLQLFGSPFEQKQVDRSEVNEKKIIAKMK